MEEHLDPQPIPDVFSREASPVPFAIIPDHELLSLIAKGSYGEVWLARTALGNHRAVKIVYERTFQHRRPFEREFNGVRKFEPISRLHEGLVDVLQVGHNTGVGCFHCVMELADDVQGGQEITPETYRPRTLAYDIAKQRRLCPAECVRIGLAIASGLGFLHRHGLIHRDIKPSNIIFVNGVPKLADIGLVVQMSEAKSYVGTEGFIPPEGPGTVQADIYSLGKVLYEISTGKDRHDFPELPTHLGETSERRQLVELNKIILKACRVEPRERYQSADELIEDLTALAKGKPVRIRTTGRRWSAVRLGTALGGLALLAAGPLIFSSGSRRSVPSTAPPVVSNSLPEPPKPVGWWPGASDAHDLADYNNGLVISGMTTVPSRFDEAFLFDGKESRIEIGDPPTFRFTNGFSISAWIWIAALPSREQELAQIFFRGDQRPGNDPYFLAVRSDGRLRLHIEEETSSAAGPRREANLDTEPVPLKEWIPVMAVFDGTAGLMRVYAAGRIIGEARTALRPFEKLALTFKGGVAIANQSSGGENQPFNGMIDELVVYPAALSDAAVRAGYLQTNPAPWTGNLLNLDFAAGENGASRKMGFAAVGQTDGDFWNAYVRKGTNGFSRTFSFGTVLTNGWLTNLKLADGTSTSIGLTVMNGSCEWNNGSWDMMYREYLCSFDSEELIVTLTNLPPGVYDLYLYSRAGLFRLTAGDVDYGTKTSTDRFPVDNPPAWREGVQYAWYRNVTLGGAGGSLTIIASPRDFSHEYAVISGLQLARHRSETNDLSRAAR